MKEEVPYYVKPMLAVPGRPFDSDEHWFEPKWDGLRCQLHLGATLRLHSRSGRDITALFPELTVADFLKRSNALLDGELICLDNAGRPSFDTVRARALLSNPHRIAQAAVQQPALYVAFDILYCSGEPLLGRPLEQRRETLESLFIPSPVGILSPITPTYGKALFAAVVDQQLEGIVGKKRSSPYIPGQHSDAWIKVRRTRSSTLWVIGYSPDSIAGVRSIALGDGVSPGITYVGHVGSGIDARSRETLLRKLASAKKASPEAYGAPRDVADKTIWIEPTLRARVEYLERTAKGHLRHPVLRGIVKDNQNEGAANE